MCVYIKKKSTLIALGGDSVVISSVITPERNNARNDYRVATLSH
jgi:hypothetical protein